MKAKLFELLTVALVSCSLQISPASAGTIDLIDDAFAQSLVNKFSSPLVRRMVAWQNKQTAGLSSDEITKLDRRWVEETKATDKSLIVAKLSNPLSIYLLQIQAASNGVYSEIFVMDSRGLNVGQSSVTSDYWQGDEAKYLKTFPSPESAIFIDEPTVDQTTGNTRVQISFALRDRDQGEKIGVVTVEVNLDALALSQSRDS